MNREAGEQRRGNDGPMFDIVLATVGRTGEVARFLASLAKQSYAKIRVILVDQNGDDRLEPILDHHGNAFPLLRVEARPGLSRARNAGLQHLAGDIVAFPDDDCTYPPDLLERVSEVFRHNPEWDGVTGRTVDPTGGSSFLLWRKEPTLVTRTNVWRTAVATTIFLRRSVVERVGAFDETLGAGSGTQWGSGEETDYVLRALAAGFTISFRPDISVVHESPRPAFSRESARKGYLTGRGNSRVLRKHGFPARFAAFRVSQLVAASIYFLARGQLALARFYWAMARGRIAGSVER
jgi:GT2 family glycosyltransferase